MKQVYSRLAIAAVFALTALPASTVLAALARSVEASVKPVV